MSRGGVSAIVVSTTVLAVIVLDFIMSLLVATPDHAKIDVTTDL